MQKVPFYRPWLGESEINEVVDTLRSGWLTTGPKTKRFEKEFAEFTQQKHAVAVNSCTAALHLALEAIGVKAGHAVLVPTMTFAATAEVVRYLGARPLLVDCRAEDFNLDVADAETRTRAALEAGQQVSAIMPVHYGGQVGDVHGVSKLAKKYNLKIVEDAAHCCPAFYRQRARQSQTNGDSRIDGTGRQRDGAKSSESSPLWSRGGTRSTQVSTESDWKPVGASADITCFSFYANKCITTGEGGMACTDSSNYADRMRIMSLHGISKDAWKRYTAEGSWYYEIIAPGYKYNLTDIASALGLRQLARAQRFHRQRAALAAMYQQRLGDLEELTLPEIMPDRIHSWHLFVIRLRLNRLTIGRAEFIDELSKAGIGTSVHYLPLHMHPYYRETYGYRPSDLPCMASIYPEVVSLPLYPNMSEGQLDYVCQAVRRLITENSHQRVSRVRSRRSNGSPFSGPEKHSSLQGTAR